MVNPFKPALRAQRNAGTICAVTFALLVGMSGSAWAMRLAPTASVMQAASLNAQTPTPGQSVVTLRGPAFITGHLGSLETTTLPGSAGQGLLMNNGNGTSTLIVPGGPSQTVMTPR